MVNDTIIWNEHYYLELASIVNNLTILTVICFPNREIVLFKPRPHSGVAFQASHEVPWKALTTSVDVFHVGCVIESSCAIDTRIRGGAKRMQWKHSFNREVLLEFSKNSSIRFIFTSFGSFFQELVTILSIDVTFKDLLQCYGYW